jgi:hypothetical protein
MDRHPLDGNAIAADLYYDDLDEEGAAIGDPCRRWNEPDEDCPKPWQCSGTMAETDGGFVACDVCGAMKSGD